MHERTGGSSPHLNSDRERIDRRAEPNPLIESISHMAITIPGPLIAADSQSVAQSARHFHPPATPSSFSFLRPCFFLPSALPRPARSRISASKLSTITCFCV